jgi:hypothetical protein
MQHCRNSSKPQNSVERGNSSKPQYQNSVERGNSSKPQYQNSVERGNIYTLNAQIHDH